MVGRHANAASSRWTHVKGVRGSCDKTRRNRGEAANVSDVIRRGCCDVCVIEQHLGSYSLMCDLQDLLSVRPQEESMSPYSGSGLEGKIHISATGTCRVFFHLFLFFKPMSWRRHESINMTLQQNFKGTGLSGLVKA